MGGLLGMIAALIGVLVALAAPARAADRAPAAPVRPVAVLQGPSPRTECSTWWRGRLVTASYSEIVLWDVARRTVEQRIPIPAAQLVNRQIVASFWRAYQAVPTRNGRGLVWWFAPIDEPIFDDENDVHVPVTVDLARGSLTVGKQILHRPDRYRPATSSESEYDDLDVPAEGHIPFRCFAPSPDRRWVIAAKPRGGARFVARATSPRTPYLSLQPDRAQLSLTSFDLTLDADRIAMLVAPVAAPATAGCSLRVLETAAMSSRSLPADHCSELDMLDDRRVALLGVKDKIWRVAIADYRAMRIEAALPDACGATGVAGMVLRYDPLNCAAGTGGRLMVATGTEPRWMPYDVAALAERRVIATGAGPRAGLLWLISCADPDRSATGDCPDARAHLLDVAARRVMAEAPLPFAIPQQALVELRLVDRTLWVVTTDPKINLRYAPLALPTDEPVGAFTLTGSVLPVADPDNRIDDFLSRPLDFKTRRDAPALGVKARIDQTASRLLFERMSDAKPLAELLPLGAEDFSVVTPYGTYDTNAGADKAGFRWRFPGEAATLPPQMFLRDYFEPGLLRRRLDCTLPDNCDKVFRPAPEIGTLARVLPVVRIVSAVAEGPGRMAVTVQAHGAVDPRAANGKTGSGLYNLRLFGDDRLVAQERPVPADADPADRAGWRGATMMAPPGSVAPQTHVFHIKVPTAPNAPLRFSAYAFNQDQVKSDTATLRATPPIASPPRKPRLYVLAIGIDAYGAGGFASLRYGVSDAQAMATLLGQFAPGHELHAETVLGTSADPATKARIAAAFARLAEATPDDAVLISYAGHGFTDARGRFSLVPSDARGADGAPVPESLISAGDLAIWLGAVDAGEIAFVIDACHSAASVSASGFKPGPLGDPGLGQLAYDKGIRILAASQPEQYAMESSAFGHGLLTYALLAGARNKAADADHDGFVRLNELLLYARDAVATLAEPAKDDPESEAPFVIRWTRDIRTARQQPSLFDYVRHPAGIGLR